MGVSSRFPAVTLATVTFPSDQPQIQVLTYNIPRDGLVPYMKQLKPRYTTGADEPAHDCAGEEGKLTMSRTKGRSRQRLRYPFHPCVAELTLLSSRRL